MRECVWRNISQASIEGIKAVLLSASIFFFLNWSIVDL